VPDNVGGQIVATVAGETIDHWPTESDGIIDHWVEVPDRLLRRSTSLEVLLSVSDNTGRRGDFHTAGAGDRLLTLTIDGDTTVQSTPATPPVPGGLQSVPQALTPQVQVGLGSDPLGDTMRAVAIVVGLQRMSALPIETVVMGMQEVIDSPNSGILIAADGWNNTDIVLPVSAAPDGPITFHDFEPDGKAATLGLDPPQQFAFLRPVFNRGRTLLIASSNGAPAALDELLAWLNSDSERWPELTGVALVSAPGHKPVTVNFTASTVAVAAGYADIGWVWWLGGGVFDVVLVGIAAVLLRNRSGSQQG